MSPYNEVIDDDMTIDLSMLYLEEKRIYERGPPPYDVGRVIGAYVYAHLSR